MATSVKHILDETWNLESQLHFNCTFLARDVSSPHTSVGNPAPFSRGLMLMDKYSVSAQLAEERPDKQVGSTIFDISNEGNSRDDDNSRDEGESSEEDTYPFKHAVRAYLSSKHIAVNLCADLPQTVHPDVIATYTAGGPSPSVDNILLDWHANVSSKWNRAAITLLSRDGLVHLRNHKLSDELQEAAEHLWGKRKRSRAGSFDVSIGGTPAGLTQPMTDFEDIN
ncbi:hypothetical protein JAAARDRAFT_195732 [Jaapia argillacea MUCL 33604]|uniref:Uncharacterized protein n=1 Tax=Jaapia argillacea MUCL 33604 TaxID=933084 RepID=A0A067PKH7_9AGAM|nr:hypothetical protein JAAARDRAFT_195732 [Jaapia argillacea MUCL 33604]